MTLTPRTLQKVYSSLHIDLGKGTICVCEGDLPLVDA